MVCCMHLLSLEACRINDQMEGKERKEIVGRWSLVGFIAGLDLPHPVRDPLPELPDTAF